MSEQSENQRLVFVVHKHQATTLHEDFRLEIGGVCGPLRSPRVRRWIRIRSASLPTTDHTLEYRHFEGVLEEGQYGAGPVMVWDEGN